MSGPEVRVVVLPHGEGLPLPAWQSDGAAGADVHAASEVTLAPGARALVPTGLRFALPPGWEMQVRPRSGLAAKHGVTVINTPGTVDADYRGELFVPLVNHGAEPFVVRRGERVAQLVFAPVYRATFTVVDTLDATVRGAGGFGSTGR